MSRSSAPQPRAGLALAVLTLGLFSAPVSGRQAVLEQIIVNEVARDYSEAPSKAAGGLVGPIDPGGLEAAVQSALAALHPQVVSAPVRTAGDYYYFEA
jgi:parvulin-like peptidyl-prolyl isomerase